MINKKLLKALKRSKVGLINRDKTLGNVNKKRLKDYLNLYNIIYIIAFICILIALGYFIIQWVNWYREGLRVKEIKESLGKVDIITEIKDENRNIKGKSEYIKKDVVKVEPEYKFLNIDFNKLKERNEDIQGYLKVNNLDIDYPVVQTIDNEFYLSHDLDKKKNSAGWIFIDCRNGLELPDFNTIIYGHNRADSVIFGGLKKLLKDEYSGLKDTQYINFITPYNNSVYQICSVYVTSYDSWRYYDTRFDSDEEKQEFINWINNQNQVDNFKRSDLSIMDNFLTLSTCYGAAGTTDRLVVHARLFDTKY